MPCAWLLSLRLPGDTCGWKCRGHKSKFYEIVLLLPCLKHHVPQRVLPRALGGLPSAPVAVVMCC